MGVGMSGLVTSRNRDITSWGHQGMEMVGSGPGDAAARGCGSVMWGWETSGLWDGGYGVITDGRRWVIGMQTLGLWDAATPGV